MEVVSLLVAVANNILACPLGGKNKHLLKQTHGWIHFADSSFTTVN